MASQASGESAAAPQPSTVCSACAASPATFLCARCDSARYCGADCQKAAWKKHKLSCVPPRPPPPPAAERCDACGGWGQGVRGESGKCGHCARVAAGEPAVGAIVGELLRGKAAGHSHDGVACGGHH